MRITATTIVQLPHTDNYYAIVFDVNGLSIHITEVCTSRLQASRLVDRWIAQTN